MKISKLFHWLYAILMLLPAFAILITCLYVVINKNAFMSFDDVYEMKDIFYYAIETIANSALFNWASNSFLSAPLLFITNLFLMPSNSPIILLICYWFNISIIWLVFDVMMYVPLLVHKWIDKAKVD